MELAAQGLEFHDLEDDVGAFTVALPRLRVIPIEQFDPGRCSAEARDSRQSAARNTHAVPPSALGIGRMHRGPRLDPCRVAATGQRGGGSDLVAHRLTCPCASPLRTGRPTLSSVANVAALSPATTRAAVSVIVRGKQVRPDATARLRRCSPGGRSRPRRRRSARSRPLARRARRGAGPSPRPPRAWSSAYGNAASNSVTSSAGGRRSSVGSRFAMTTSYASTGLVPAGLEPAAVAVGEDQRRRGVADGAVRVRCLALELGRAPARIADLGAVGLVGLLCRRRRRSRPGSSPARGSPSSAARIPSSVSTASSS